MISGRSFFPALAAALLLLTGRPAVAQAPAVEVVNHYVDIPQAALDEITARGTRIRAKLEAFFGRDVPRPIIIDLGPRHRVGHAIAERNTVGFPKSIVDRNAVVLAHEMTHLIMPEHHWYALREGIAVYAQDRFGEVKGYPNLGNDLDRMLIRRLKQRPDAKPRTFLEAEAFFRRVRAPKPGETKLTWRDIDQWDRRNAYLLGGSFARYLLDVVLKGDMATFKRLYMSGDIAGVVGRPVEAIQADWLRATGLDEVQ